MDNQPRSSSKISRRQLILGSLAGVVRLPLWLKEYKYWPSNLVWGCHHMGTTHMHDDPKQGVVNKHGQVHGIDNLYIAGSSVYPTSGWANPTFTLIALAMRLADRLKTLLS